MLPRPRRCRRFPVAVAAIVTAALAAFFAAPRLAHAAPPSEQYLLVRQNYAPRPGLTLASATQNPDNCRGATLEVSGRLVGMARNGSEGASLLIDTEGPSGVLSLPMSRVPDWVQNGARLRALCVVGGAKQEGVRIGVPDLLILAVASESDVVVIEARWRASAQARRRARAERDRQTRRELERLAAAYAARGGSRLPGRSGGVAARTLGGRPFVLASRGAGSAAARGGAGGSLLLDPSVYGQYREFIQRTNPRLSDRHLDNITGAILRYSEQMDVDPRLVVAVLLAESSFNPGATSRTGAMGLGQIMPGTAAEIGLTNPYDPVQNVAGAVYLLRTRLDKYSGGAASGDLQTRHIVLALAAYNAGMGAVKRYGGVPPYRETRNYVKKVERLYRQLCGQNDPAAAGTAANNGEGGGAAAS